MPPNRKWARSAHLGVLLTIASLMASLPVIASDGGDAPTAPGHESFTAHFLAWLGKFHPPAVNFPVGLLVAAAVAEFLLIVTKRSIFAACTRYCIWFGAISAVVAATLGWFFAATQPPDWLLTTHRWLGTSTAAWSLLLLAIAELQYRGDEKKLRYAFRFILAVAACLVLVTGFFGGAMVYGIDHYSWPADGQQDEKEAATGQNTAPITMTASPHEPVGMVGQLTVTPHSP